MTAELRSVRMKPKMNQPKKAELEEPFVIRRGDGSMPTPEEPARVALAPMTIIEDPEAKQPGWDYSL